MKKTLLVFLFLFSIVCFTNIQTSAASTVAKGKCGKNATWILSEDGVMHIKGKGILKGEKNGWNKYQYKIKKIVIGKGNKTSEYREKNKEWCIYGLQQVREN